MMSLSTALKQAVRGCLRPFGVDVTRIRPQTSPDETLPGDFSTEDKELYEAVRPYTMTTPERIYSLSHAVEHVVRNGIAGEFVECGCWKGGAGLAMVLTLLRLGDRTRHVYLYDTFDEGWPAPGDEDVTADGKTPQELHDNQIDSGLTYDDLWAKFDEVQELIRSTGYPKDLIHIVKGKVENTVPEQAPESIALLRLDTDWYASTKHEYEHLYPRLARQGVLIVDDYGLWKGSRKATDDYFAAHNIPMLLHRIDDTCRAGIKP